MIAEIRRLQAENSELLLDLAAERSRRQRAEANSESLAKKVERLSMRIIAFWGRSDGK
jgi:hypothetical protein